jgi:hypothetical protein
LERDCLLTIKIMANWIVHILRRDCLLKQIIEGKIDGMGRRGEDVSSY